MRWPEDLTDWPNKEVSRRISVRPHDWHVQEMGQGPTILLLHGAGGATHSWRDILPMLARDFHAVAVDLPGQGFTRMGSRHRSGLEQMATDLAALIAAQGWRPTCIVGHSAGGAIALRLAQRLADPQLRVMGINPALAPFKGLAGIVFPMVARALSLTPLVVDIAVGSLASDARIRSILAGTGSDIGPEGTALYARLFRDRGHVDGTLLMMAQWKLDGLLADLPHLSAPAEFLIGGNDGAVPPDVAKSAADRMPDARVTWFDGRGHLMHEVEPELFAERIADWANASN